MVNFCMAGNRDRGNVGFHSVPEVIIIRPASFRAFFSVFPRRSENSDFAELFVQYVDHFAQATDTATIEVERDSRKFRQMFIVGF